MFYSDDDDVDNAGGGDGETTPTFRSSSHSPMDAQYRKKNDENEAVEAPPTLPRDLWINAATRRPTSVAYIAPSVTTFNDLNPGYRSYKVDSEYWVCTFANIEYSGGYRILYSVQCI